MYRPKHVEQLRNIGIINYTTRSHLDRPFYKIYIGCPTTYQIRHFFNNSKTNEDIASKHTHTTDTFLIISHTTNVILFKSRCNILIGFRIIKEMSGLVGSGTLCITMHGSINIKSKLSVIIIQNIY